MPPSATIHHALLACDCSTIHPVVSLQRGDQEWCGRWGFPEAGRHASGLAELVRAACADLDVRVSALDGIAIGVGPGSFTGLRVLFAFAKAVAYATGCKLVGFGSLEALALQAPADALDVQVVAEARQEMLYVGGFWRPRHAEALASVGAARLVSVAEWMSGLSETAYVTGPALERLEPRLRAMDRLRLAPYELRWPRPESIRQLARLAWERADWLDPASAEPQYLHASAAEEKAGLAERSEAAARG